MLGLMNQISMIFVVTAALALTITLIVSYRVCPPPDHRSERDGAGCPQVFKGELKSRVNIDCRIIELNELGITFNKMADALESAETQRRDFVANVSTRP
jgi:nitrate/nitrite-specific signal transduction histidine kinase